MGGSKLTIKFTDDQQNQVRNPTGKNISELTIDLVATGHLNAERLRRHPTLKQ